VELLLLKIFEILELLVVTLLGLLEVLNRVQNGGHHLLLHGDHLHYFLSFAVSMGLVVRETSGRIVNFSVNFVKI
jgi:hypothetical protein